MGLDHVQSWSVGRSRGQHRVRGAALGDMGASVLDVGPWPDGNLAVDMGLGYGPAVNPRCFITSNASSFGF